MDFYDGIPVGFRSKLKIFANDVIVNTVAHQKVKKTQAKNNKLINKQQIINRAISETQVWFSVLKFSSV